MSAITATQESGIGSGVSSSKNPAFRATPEKYVSLGSLIGDYAKPDNRDLLINTYGDQGITGFLALTGATRSAGVADEVQYWEEGRLHKKIKGALVKDGGAGSDAQITTDLDGATPSDSNAGTKSVRVNDVLMNAAGDRLVVKTVTASTNSAADKYDVVPLDGSAASTLTNTSGTEDFIVIGNVVDTTTFR